MFKFIKPKGPHVGVERQKLQKELFCYRRTLQHGFPHKPTAMAWDPTLRLLCVGTATGAIKVFGKPGVEFYGLHADNVAVTQIVFLPNAGRVVSLCEDNSLHLWEVNKSSLVQVKSHSMEGKLKKISALCIDSKAENLLLGTEGGNIYILELNTFVMSQEIIYQDVVMQNASHKLNPGAVECLLEQPGEPDHLLIAYNRGLIVILDRKDFSVVKKFTPSQQLESVCWHHDGLSFTTSHNDGSHLTWSVESENPVSGPTTDYGPFACKAILKIERYEMNGEPLIVFSGGLPRANFGERFNVTVMNGDRHVAFEFTSKVIDFVVITTPENAADDGDDDEVVGGEPEALIVLAEEELVAIDLQSEDWRMMNLPYMVPVHASAITCSQYVSGVPEDLWNQLKDAGRAQTKHLYSTKAWPIDGGELLCSKGQQPLREMLLTGHEDGTVRFWDAGNVNLTPIYKFSTSQFFTGEDMHDEDLNADDEEDFPPFRKTGVFDPYTDDPRLAVKRVVLCPLSGTLVIAGTAGHVVIAKFDTETMMEEVRITTMNIVGERDSFVWKGHNELTPRKGEITQKRGFQAASILQIYPPAAVTCATLHADWGLVAAGTSHGLALYDYVKHKPVTVKCTLNPHDLNSAGDAPISRRKSFKKSLRESFRRLRKGRSQRRTSNTNTTNSATSPPARRLPASNDESGNPLEAKPVERQIEARPVDDGMGSIVRCLYFARTFLINVQNTVPTLWAGTNAGAVYVFTINVPSASKRQTDDVTCQLGKEIQLKHRAPIIAIAVLDSSSRPLPEPLEVERGISPLPETTQPHRVIIASEEQFKIFTLPALKPFGKYKLTAHEGARVRRMSFANFSCNLPDSNDVHNEVDLLCLTNIGDCFVLTLPDLKRQLNAVVVRKEDINGISSLIFTKEAEALYLHSSSELQRLSLATRRVTSARCYLSLPEATKEETEVEAVSEQDEVDEDKEKDAPLVNGNTTDSKENSVGGDKMENGESDTIHNSTMNSTMTSSIGDITIDSVKDHLNAQEDLNNRLSGITITKTTITTSTLNQSGEVVTNTTTTTTTTEHADDDVENNETDELASEARTVEIKSLRTNSQGVKAPLALSEDLEAESGL